MAHCLFFRNLCFSTFAININYNIFQYIIKMKIFCYENPKKKKIFLSNILIMEKIRRSKTA